MAKVKTAKQRISDYLKAKGLDSAEIKDAFDELDSADVDLDNLAVQLTNATQKNQEWQAWYQGVAPEVQSAIQERDALKAQLDQLEAAGIKVNMPRSAQITEQKIEQGDYVSQADLKKFQQDLIAATSTVMKQLNRVGLRHFKDFNEEADLDAIEQLVTERGYSVEDAYNSWVTPKRDERREKETQDKIQRGIQEGLQAEMSKQGIRQTRKRTDDVEPAPLDKPAPSDAQLRDAFVSDLNTDVTH